MPLSPEDRSKSIQTYGTPWEFIHACERKFGPIIHDIAAEAHTAKAPTHWTKEDDAFSKNWAEAFPTGNLWLNPPFKDIRPWAKKCADESRHRDGLILFLTPASVGTVWFRDCVWGWSRVFPVQPRLVFDGTPPNPKTGKPDPYPKDLMLTAYSRDIELGLEPSDWRTW